MCGHYMRVSLQSTQKPLGHFMCGHYMRVSLQWAKVLLRFERTQTFRKKVVLNTPKGHTCRVTGILPIRCFFIFGDHVVPLVPTVIRIVIICN